MPLPGAVDLSGTDVLLRIMLGSFQIIWKAKVTSIKRTPSVVKRDYAFVNGRHDNLMSLIVHKEQLQARSSAVCLERAKTQLIVNNLNSPQQETITNVA
jgi:hypothetical protein